MSRAEEARRADPDTQRGVSNSFRTAFEPERQAIEQFDDLIGKLDAEPGSRVKAPRPH